MILTLSGSSGCGSGGRHSDFRSFSSCSVCKARREQEQWAGTEPTFMLVPCSTAASGRLGGHSSPEQDKQFQPDKTTLLQALLPHSLSIQQGTAAPPAVRLFSPVAASPLLVFAAPLPPLSSSSSPVPPSFCAPFPGLHARMPDMLHPAAASGLGFGSSPPCKHKRRERSGLAGPKVKAQEADSRPEGAGTASGSQEHTHQVTPHLRYHKLLKGKPGLHNPQDTNCFPRLSGNELNTRDSSPTAA